MDKHEASDLEAGAAEVPSSVDHRRLSRPGVQKGNSYTEEQKTLALAVYAESGSLQTAADQSSIPRNTIRYWIENDPEIDSTLDTIRRAIRERAAFLFAEISVRSAEELLDRVTNGDYHVDREGNITRRPIPGRELAFIMSMSTDKHALVTGTMTRVNAEDQALTRIADKLVKAIEARRRPTQVVEEASGDAS